MEENERVSFSVTRRICISCCFLCVTKVISMSFGVALRANSGDDASISCGVEMTENGFFYISTAPISMK